MKYIIAALLIVISSAQIVTGCIAKPYRQGDGLLESNHTIKSFKKMGNLKVNKNIFSIYKELQFVSSLNIPYAFSFYTEYGFILLADKTPYPFCFVMPSHSYPLQLALNKSPYILEKEVIFMIPNHTEITYEIKKCFQNKNINFPQNYHIAKSIKYYNAYENDTSTLNIFVHNTINTNQ